MLCDEALDDPERAVLESAWGVLHEHDLNALLEYAIHPARAETGCFKHLLDVMELLRTTRIGEGGAVLLDQWKLNRVTSELLKLRFVEVVALSIGGIDPVGDLVLLRGQGPCELLAEDGPVTRPARVAKSLVVVRADSVENIEHGDVVSQIVFSVNTPRRADESVGNVEVELDGSLQ